MWLADSSLRRRQAGLPAEEVHRLRRAGIEERLQRVGLGGADLTAQQCIEQRRRLFVPDDLDARQSQLGLQRFQRISFEADLIDQSGGLGLIGGEDPSGRQWAICSKVRFARPSSITPLKRSNESAMISFQSSVSSGAISLKGLSESLKGPSPAGRTSLRSRWPASRRRIGE